MEKFGKVVDFIKKPFVLASVSAIAGGLTVFIGGKTVPAMKTFMTTLKDSNSSTNSKDPEIVDED